jgi:glutathione S-transferase
MRVLWTIEELGLPVDLHTLKFPPRVFDRGYLDINPLGTVPLLLDGDVRMTESSAICHYLAARYGPELNVPADDPAFGDYLQWLSFSEATLTFPLAIMLRYTMVEPEERRLPQAVEDYRRFFLGRLGGIESRLADGRAHLCGERFTAADIAVGYALHLAAFFKMAPEFPAGVAAYFQRVTSRPAYQRACR